MLEPKEQPEPRHIPAVKVEQASPSPYEPYARELTSRFLSFYKNLQEEVPQLAAYEFIQYQDLEPKEAALKIRPLGSAHAASFETENQIGAFGIDLKKPHAGLPRLSIDESLNPANKSHYTREADGDLTPPSVALSASFIAVTPFEGSRYRVHVWGEVDAEEVGPLVDNIVPGLEKILPTVLEVDVKGKSFEESSERLSRILDAVTPNVIDHAME